MPDLKKLIKASYPPTETRAPAPIHGSFDRDEFQRASESEWEQMVEAKRAELEARFGPGTLITDDETDGHTWCYTVQVLPDHS